MSRRVEYEAFGGPEALRLVDEDVPRPGPGEVLVRVQAAGLNPVDHKIFAGGATAARFGAVPPAGVGHDLAGVVVGIGEGVHGFSVGDRVLGGARHRALADHVLIGPGDVLVPRPEGLPLPQAAALAIAGLTAVGSLKGPVVGEGDVVLVSASAGGVGVLAAQLALRAGARVIGTAGPSNQEFLRSLGVLPLLYGTGLAARVREVCEGLDAVLDFHGSETILAALELGVAPERINSVATRDFADRGIRSFARTEADPAELEHVARLVASGDLVLPIEAVYPLERTAEAYVRQMSGHLRGKIVVTLEDGRDPE